MNKFALLVASPSVFLLADAFAHEGDPTYNGGLAKWTAAVFVTLGFTVFLIGQWEQYKKDRAEEQRRGQAIADILNASFKSNIK